MTGIGHNGGPDLEARQFPAVKCATCALWKPPIAADVRRYEAFRSGASKQRARKPSGYCVNQPDPRGGLLRYCGSTDAEHGCRNWQAKQQEDKPPPGQGRGWVTVWQVGRIAWQGHEEDAPGWALQDALNL